MPGLNGTLIGAGHHQTLNSSKTEKSERKWNIWPRRWFRRRSSGEKADISSGSGQTLVNIEGPSNSQAGRAEDDTLTSPHQSMEDIVQDNMVCLLCLQLPKEWFLIRACGCRFCLQCMEMYAQCSVRSGEVPITCPDGRCPLIQRNRTTVGGHLTRNEVRQLVPNDVFPLYLRLQLNTEVADNPTLMWCPNPGCETVCTVKDVAANSRKRKKFLGIIPIKSRLQTRKKLSQSVLCPSCQYSFCSQCKTPWHPDASCPSLSQLLGFTDSKSKSINGESSDHHDPIAQLERDGRIKRCPFCQVPIERDDGCAQMMCKHCRHVFCWFCLTSLDDDFMLRHYDAGPCRSRLGHSRVSVVWHRTQVVSAFLGLGVLFLVTSPLLLLASPCFFCWRRHSNKSKKSFTLSNTTAATTNPSSTGATPLDGASQEDL